MNDELNPTPSRSHAAPGTGRSRRPVFLAAAAAAAALVLVGVVGVVIAGGGDDDEGGDLVAVDTASTGDTGAEPDGGDTASAPAVDPGDVLELSTGETDPLMMSCMAITPEVVADVPMAFRATVTAVESDQVTLAIDTWYKGGDAATATLTAPPGLEALIGGIEFVVGEPYLITAFDGVINYCGLSGPADATLQAIFDEAFAG